MQPRNYFALSALALVASLAATGCARRQVEVTTGGAGEAGAAAGMGTGMTMNARLAPQGGANVSGTATASHTDANSFRSTVSINGAQPNATHPWHVHSGRCADKGPVVGLASAYPVLQTDATGAATANAAVPVAMPSGPLSVNVHLSPSQMGTIVACGDLETGQ